MDQSTEILVSAVVSALTAFGIVFGWVGKAWRFLLRLFKSKPPTEDIAQLIIVVRTLHSGLLSQGKLDAATMQNHLKRLSCSEHQIWSNAKHFECRERFVSIATSAFKVRKTHEWFRNEIEASEYSIFLNNAKERIVAALENRPLPQEFDPHEDERPSTLAKLLRGCTSARFWVQRLFQ